ncbi:MAG: Protein YchN [Thermoanaerobaculia bacterium]|nr:Protein YchN [Thermoanaerobaculia bacterium]
MAHSHLFVLNDGPYGTERSYNALRWALALLKRPDTAVRVFLLADAVQCAVRGQETPQGYYNVERMLKSIASRGAAAT